MRHALVVYESMFGNTRAVAEAVAEGLRAAGRVDLVEVGQAARTLPDDVDLLVVGGPTHAFGLSRPSTRRSAAEQGGDPGAAEHGGLREWLDTAQLRPGLAAAAFDTRVAKPKLPGTAAGAAHRRLKQHRLRPVARAEDFWVSGVSGPLLDGERERARQWGAGLAAV